MRKCELLAIVVAVVILGLVGVGCSGGGDSTTTNSTTVTSTTTTVSTGDDTTTQPVETTESTESSTTLEPSSTTTTASAPAVRYQQGNSHIKYTGSWKTTANAGASGGSFAFLNSTGKVTITFSGTHLSLIAKKSPNYGKAAITLDGKKVGTIDLYNVDAVYGKKVWGTGTLKPGTHTVIVQWTGTKRSAASGTNINIDAVVVTGTLE